MTATSSKSKFPSGKGGYPRSAHMTANAGPRGGSGGGHGQKPHTGFLKSGEKNAWVKGPRPDEEHKGYKKGITGGHNFESEIKETFKKGGPANIKGTAMPHKNSPTPSEGVSHDHGHKSGKAEHHPGMADAYRFRSPAQSGTHGFGHANHQKCGPLRMSGNSGAHRIGARRGK